ncbi:MAG: dihydropteroate synthase [Muribaculaceae bacterium]|nr:dihydropteroate synthase [Muribaculaceae bacterium]
MKPFSLNIRGRLVEYDRPAVMGIINITDDSFYAGSRVCDRADIARRARAMVESGADMLDLGAYSSRPGAGEVPIGQELERLAIGLEAVREAVGPEVPVSVDTFRAEVARRCIADFGADIVNDISGGLLDDAMFETVAGLGCPYILMHMRGTPATMQSLTDYADVTADVINELSRRLYILDELGVADVIVDPGFGFAKTLEQNYAMMRELKAFEILGRPVLAGVSRKSMITRLLGIDAADAATPTAVLGAFALDRGAAILRVHDVEQAVQSVRIFTALNS